jgi:hypothetical protein
MSGAKFINKPSIVILVTLTATHAIAAIQTFVASAAAYGNMPAGITSGCVALHTFGCCIYCL